MNLYSKLKNNQFYNGLKNVIRNITYFLCVTMFLAFVLKCIWHSQSLDNQIIKLKQQIEADIQQQNYYEQCEPQTKILIHKIKKNIIKKQKKLKMKEKESEELIKKFNVF